MPWSYARDPVTGDRIPDGNGGWTKTTTSENLVRNQLKGHFGKVWQDARLGSQLHDLKAFQRNPAVLAPADAKRALERVVDAGRISDLEVEAEAPRAGRVNLSTRYVDTTSGQVVTGKIPVGG
jgi:phage gp46-like protein